MYWIYKSKKYDPRPYSIIHAFWHWLTGCPVQNQQLERIRDNTIMSHCPCGTSYEMWNAERERDYLRKKRRLIMTPRFYPKNKAKVEFRDFPAQTEQVLIQCNGQKRITLITYLYTSSQTTAKSEYRIYQGEVLKQTTQRLDTAIYWYNQL